MKKISKKLIEFWVKMGNKCGKLNNDHKTLQKNEWNFT